MDIAVPAGGPTTVFQTLQELHFPEGSVVFEGEKEDVASYYQSAQLLMHTSETEGFGLCLVEACFSDSLSLHGICQYTVTYWTTAIMLY